MARHRVVRTRKESAWGGGAHRHIAALCLTTGPMISKAEAIARIRARIDSYYTEAAGLVAEVEVVDRCSLCGTDYLRTNRDETPANNLLNLPDC